MSGSGKRLIFEDERTLVRGLCFTGYDAPRAARPGGLYAHDHGQAYELCLIVRGSVDWWVGRGEVYQVRQGEMYFTRPHERHGGIDAVLQPCELYWCGLILDDRAGFAGLAHKDRRLLARRFAAMTHRHFRGDDRVRDAFARMVAAQRDGGELAALECRAACLDLLLGTLRCHDRHASRQRRISPPIRRAMQWMREHLDDDASIQAVASHVGLTVTRFHERFHREIGLPPADWRTRQRIGLAKTLLRRSDQSVTRIAMDCGFSSSQYFATAFKRLVGVSPRDYRRTQAG